MRNTFISFISAALFIITLVLLNGCDKLPFTEETQPDQLPPMPEKCISFSIKHKNALLISYSSAEASQLQTVRVANELAQCLESEGFSRADVKGMIKKNEADTREDVEKGRQP